MEASGSRALYLSSHPFTSIPAWVPRSLYAIVETSTKAAWTLKLAIPFIYHRPTCTYCWQAFLSSFVLLSVWGLKVSRANGY